MAVKGLIVQLMRLMNYSLNTMALVIPMLMLTADQWQTRSG